MPASLWLHLSKCGGPSLDPFTVAPTSAAATLRCGALVGTGNCGGKYAYAIKNALYQAVVLRTVASPHHSAIT